jgi:hypothetical protein
MTAIKLYGLITNPDSEMEEKWCGQCKPCPPPTNILSSYSVVVILYRHAFRKHPI